MESYVYANWKFDFKTAGQKLKDIMIQQYENSQEGWNKSFHQVKIRDENLYDMQYEKR